MNYIYGNWNVNKEQFCLWGESDNKKVNSPANGRSGKKKQIKQMHSKKSPIDQVSLHPYALSQNDLRLITEELFPNTPFNALSAIGELIVRIPTIKDENPLRPPDFRTHNSLKIDINSQMTTKLKSFRVPVIILPANQLLSYILTLEENIGEFRDLRISTNSNTENSQEIFGQSMLFWINAAKFALECLVQEFFIPRIHEDVLKETHRISWEMDLPSEMQEKFAKLAKLMPNICRTIEFNNSNELISIKTLLSHFINYLIDDFIRRSLNQNRSIIDNIFSEQMKKNPKSIKRELKFIANFVQACTSLDSSIKNDDNFYPEDVEKYNHWINQIHSPYASNAAFRTCFKLDFPDKPETLNLNSMYSYKSKKYSAKNLPLWTLNFYLQAKADPSLLVPADLVWKERSSTLKYLQHQFENPQERLLEDLGRASRFFPSLEEPLNSGHPVSLELLHSEVSLFINEIVPLLQVEGFGVIIPSEIGSSKRKIGLSLKVRPKLQSNSFASFLSISDLVEYDWEIALGQDILSIREFEQLTQLKASILKLRGQWVEINPQDLQKINQFLKSYKNQKQKFSTEHSENIPEMPLIHAIKYALSQIEPEWEIPIQTVDAEGFLKDFFNIFQGTKKIAPINPPKYLQGTLRPYQIIGTSWMTFMRQFGFGVCLADDMGLGKTVQLIALMLSEKEKVVNGFSQKTPSETIELNKQPSNRRGRPKSSKATQTLQSSNHSVLTSIIICPMTVIRNWVKEFEKFAPSFKILVHHGKDRANQNEFFNQIKNFDFLITSYALVVRDFPLFSEIRWNTLVLDEAQNIKNISAKQTRNIKNLNAMHRIALTGTPIENRVAELWSILDFLNPGYLGSFAEFKQSFAIPIERYHDPHKTTRLQQLIQPFILRRLKSDKNIIQDLPEKIEITEYCQLTREQASLYEAVVQEMVQKIEKTTGIDRKGNILATLMKLKQICNHPAQFLHTNIEHAIIEGRSGKLLRLKEILLEIIPTHEKILIFTQFREMGFFLQKYLEKELRLEIPFLYGGTPKKQRDLMIQQFQEPGQGLQIFLLSLKAGGVGLNLTAANHVIHYDRWWNPAVENQASDRVYRIGQSKTVQIAKFLCIGTVEEKIDEMIERKKELANNIIATGENWITELDITQLKSLFTLNKTAIAEEIAENINEE